VNVPSINARLLLRLQVEEFLYHEAGLLDDWLLHEWLALFAADGRYEVAPTGDAEAAALASAESLFLVADDHERLEQRVIRLLKPTAHAEFPHSRTRHTYSNVRVLAESGDLVDATVNFVTFRNKRSITATYMGRHLFRLIRQGDSFLIKSKRAVLDLDSLVPQGKVSLIL
jgi:p-cumate 2,3-dioxygenase subunit beta